jgi:hypothetical protein
MLNNLLWTRVHPFFRWLFSFPETVETIVFHDSHKIEPADKQSVMWSEHVLNSGYYAEINAALSNVSPTFFKRVSSIVL